MTNEYESVMEEVKVKINSLRKQELTDLYSKIEILDSTTEFELEVISLIKQEIES